MTHLATVTNAGRLNNGGPLVVHVIRTPEHVRQCRIPFLCTNKPCTSLRRCISSTRCLPDGPHSMQFLG